jgi:hypothetical protein
MRVLRQDIVKVVEGHLNVLDGEKGLVVLLVGGLERDVKADTLGSEDDVEHTGVFERHESRFLVDPEGDVGGLEVEALNAESGKALVLGRVCGGGVSIGNTDK